MTIKEIEARSGMTRANIRFYETEGLLSPKRNENGYRDYSEEDLNILMRIKLLRTLNISLEEIKAIHNKEHELEEVLEKHVKELETEKEHIEQSQNVCRIMRDNRVQYETLDARYYLDTMEAKDTKAVYDKKEDVIPKLRAPWRRYFARTLDLAIYSTIWNIILTLVFRVNIFNMGNAGDLLNFIFIHVLVLLIEPLLLSKFGTTIGKAIFGLYVTDFGRDKLSYREASYRTIMVLWKGLGFNLPIYAYIRLWKSYFTLMHDTAALEWEDESVIVLRDKKKWRIFAYAGMRLVLVAVLQLSLIIAATPKNRGDITVAEFCENYNQLASYYDLELRKQFDSEGNWTDPLDTYFADVEGGPEFVFIEENGKMTGMSFTVENDNDYYSFSDYNNIAAISTMAFIGAQEDAGLISVRVVERVIDIMNNPYEDFEYTECGVKVKCHIEYRGYSYSDTYNMLWNGMGEQSFYMKFSMEK